MTSSFGNYEIMSLNHYIDDMFKEYTIETKFQSYSPIVFISRRIARDTSLGDDYINIFKFHFRIGDDYVRKTNILKPKMYFVKPLR